MPYWVIFAEACCAWKKGSVMVKAMTRNRRYVRAYSGIALFAARFAISKFRSPRLLETSAEKPTPVPMATAIIRFCMENASETAVRASSSMRATNRLSTML